MDVGREAPEDLPHLARLAWLLAAPQEQAREPVESFAASLQAWWSDHAASHLPFLARVDERAVVGTALVRAGSEHATALGTGRVTVHSSHLAVPVCERLGFSSSPELLHRVVD